jgi:hypothetical protein
VTYQPRATPWVGSNNTSSALKGRDNLVFPAFTGRTDGIAASPVLSECSKRMSKGLLAMTARLFMLNISSKQF